YQWTVGSTILSTSDTFALNIPKYGKYGAQLTVTTGAGCSMISSPQSISVHAIPKAGFTPQPDVTTVAKPYFDFINTSSSSDNANMNCLWNFGPEAEGGKDRTSADCNPKSINFASVTGLKSIKLKITTEFGCSDEYSTTVRIDPDITVFIPNAFYPGSKVPCLNGDPDCNTIFKPAAAGYQTIEVFVFNRWGQQVF